MPTIFTFSFPFRSGDTSFPQRSDTDEDAIKSSLIQIVTTGKGERVMRGGFGCDAFAMVFENTDSLFRRKAEREIRSSVSRWEPRVRIDAVAVEAHDELNEPGRVRITIDYTIVLSGEQDKVTVEGVI
jgi:phage baseplate assembly protein W